MIVFDRIVERPLEFDPRFKNPCWYGTGNDAEALFNDRQLHCLPYFYVIGVKKSGTTDLFYRLCMHPQVLYAGEKEPQWFPRVRFSIDTTIFEYRSKLFQRLVRMGLDHTNVTFYISMYDKVARKIQDKSTFINGHDYHSHITGDATPANLHVNKYWELLPGNENVTEPRYTNLNYIKHLNPGAKIIVIFRDPVSRVYSDYLHMSHGFSNSSSDKFVQQCKLLTTAYNTCFQQHTLRECVYNNSIIRMLENQGVVVAESFISSLYVVFMRDILTVFGKENVLPLLLSEYIEHMPEVLNTAYRFLGLHPINDQAMSSITNVKVLNQSKKQRKVGPIKSEAADMLYKFFEPYNKMMATLMNDGRYLFSKTNT